LFKEVWVSVVGGDGVAHDCNGSHDRGQERGLNSHVESDTNTPTKLLPSYELAHPVSVMGKANDHVGKSAAFSTTKVGGSEGRLSHALCTHISSWVVLKCIVRSANARHSTTPNTRCASTSRGDREKEQTLMGSHSSTAPPRATAVSIASAITHALTIAHQPYGVIRMMMIEIVTFRFRTECEKKSL
jgi:hypothetical protein